MKDKSQTIAAQPAASEEESEVVEPGKKRLNELGEKPIGRLLLQYALPAITAMAASSLYNIIDGIFIGQGVGPEAIMGLALTGPLMALGAAFGAMVGVGGATLMSVRLGQKDYRTAQDILGNVLFMNVVMGLGLGILLQVFLTHILRFFGASDVTLGPARDFMTVILCGNVITHLYLGMNALLRSTNRPREAMLSTIGTVVANCLLAPLFIFVFHWGIRGAAAATVCAQFLMLCRQFYLFTDKTNLVHLRFERPNISGRIIFKALTIGLPQFLINLCACLVAIIITRSMTLYGAEIGAGGDVAVGSYGIANRLILFAVMLTIGLNQGMQPIAGFNYGAKRYDRLIEVLKKAGLFATVITFISFCIYFFFATPLVTLFAKGSPQLIEEAAHGLRIMTFTFPLVGIQIITTAFLQSIGQTGKSIFLSLTRQLLFLVPLLFLFPRLFDNPVDGVWYSMPVADTMAFLIAIALQAWQVKKFRCILAEKTITQ